MNRERWINTRSCFNPSWGRHLGKIRPAPGNHDYETGYGEDYFSYFGDAAGNPDEGYYSYEMGAWHIIVLNSNCLSIDGCGPSSPQISWLKKDLESHPNLCTLAYWHHARWSSGYYGDADWLDTFWQVLNEYGVELIINGHDHYYERLKPQNPGETLTWRKESGKSPREPGEQVLMIFTN